MEFILHEANAKITAIGIDNCLRRSQAAAESDCMQLLHEAFVVIGC